MGILAFIFVFVIGALFAAADGDYSGVEVIVKVILWLVLSFGLMYMIAACMGAFG